MALSGGGSVPSQMPHSSDRSTSEPPPLHPPPSRSVLDKSPSPGIPLHVWEMEVSQRMAVAPSGLTRQPDGEHHAMLSPWGSVLPLPPPLPSSL